MNSHARSNLRYALVIILFGAYAWAATQYGNVLLLDNIAFASLPTAAAANQGGLAYDTTNDVLSVSTTTGVSSEWVNQWQQGTRTGSKLITASATDAVSAYNFKFTGANAFTASGARNFSVDIAGGAEWGSDDIGVVSTENNYLLGLPSFGDVSLVTAMLEYMGPLSPGIHQRYDLESGSVAAKVAGTGGGDFTIIVTSNANTCTFTWPCALTIDTPTLSNGSGTCLMESIDYAISTIDATACTTPPTLHPTPTLVYRVRSVREP